MRIRVDNLGTSPTGRPYVTEEFQRRSAFAEFEFSRFSLFPSRNALKAALRSLRARFFFRIFRIVSPGEIFSLRGL